MASWSNDDWYNASLMSASCAAHATLDGFPANKYYHYRVAFEYDGFQISPMSAILDDHTTGSTGDACSITLTICNVAALNRRVTAILLFKAMADTSYGKMKTAYRLVERIPPMSSRWTLTVTSGVTSAAVTVQDVVADTGAMFEALAGFPETLEQTWIN